MKRLPRAEFYFFATGDESAIRLFDQNVKLRGSAVRRRRAIPAALQKIPGEWLWQSAKFECVTSEPSEELLRYITEHPDFWQIVTEHRARLVAFWVEIVTFRDKDGVRGCYLSEEFLARLVMVKASVDIDMCDR